MKSTLKAVCPLFVVLFASTTPAGTAALKQDKAAEIDKLFNWVSSSDPGCVVAVAQNGETVVNRAYGLADLERGAPLTTNSMFDIASVRKQFIAAAILILAEEGKLSLDDDVHKYVPELPDYGRKVTIDHLLTHTSGMRDWDPLLSMAGGGDVWSLILRQRGLNFVPGEEMGYTNSGYVLLKEIVERAGKVSFGEFARKRFFEPFGMKTAMYVEDLRDVIKNRALAYSKEGDQWKLSMLLDENRGGSGALLGTASDLLAWNEGLSRGLLSKFVTEKLHEPAKLNNGRVLRFGRGIFIDDRGGVKVYWHSGSANGYSTWIGRLPEQKLNIAITCNEDAVTSSSLANRVAQVFVPLTEAEKAQKPPVGATVSSQELKEKAGLFFNEETGAAVRLLATDTQLRFALGPALLAVSKDRFRNPNGTPTFMSQDEFELNFLSKDRFDLKSMEGKVTHYRRAVPPALTASDLKAFSGRYESDEIGTVFTIEPQTDGLGVRIQSRSAVALPIAPVDPDTFGAGLTIMRFNRDASGKVVSFDYSTPNLRNIRFYRLPDR